MYPSIHWIFNGFSSFSLFDWLIIIGVCHGMPYFQTSPNNGTQQGQNVTWRLVFAGNKLSPRTPQLYVLSWDHGESYPDAQCIWVNYNISLTWIKAIWGSFPLLTMIIVRSQWGRYHLPRFYGRFRPPSTIPPDCLRHKALGVATDARSEGRHLGHGQATGYHRNYHGEWHLMAYSVCIYILYSVL